MHTPGTIKAASVMITNVAIKYLLIAITSLTVALKEDEITEAFIFSYPPAINQESG